MSLYEKGETQTTRTLYSLGVSYAFGQLLAMRGAQILAHLLSQPI